MLKVKAPRKTSFKSPGQSFAATKAKQNCTRATLCSTKLQATGATGTENKHLELYIQTIIQSFDVYGGAKLCPCLYMACNRFADICCHCGLQIGAANLCPCGSQPTGLRAYGPTGRALGLRARLQAYGPGPLAYDTGSTGPRAYGPYGPTGRAYGPTGPDLGLPRGQWPCIYIYITISLVGGYRFYGISPTMY